MKHERVEHKNLVLTKIAETTDRPVWLVTLDRDEVIFIQDKNYSPDDNTPSEAIYKHYHSNIAPLLNELGLVYLLAYGSRAVCRVYYRGIRRGIVQQLLSYSVFSRPTSGAPWGESELLAWSKIPGEDPQCYWSRDLKEILHKTATHAHRILELGLKK